MPAPKYSTYLRDVFTPNAVANGVSSPALQLPLTFANPSLFLASPPPASNPSGLPLQSLALNADGSQNSYTTPAPARSVISVFVNGMSPNPKNNGYLPQLFSDGGWIITNVVQANPFVLQVELQVPSKLVNNFACTSDISLCSTQIDIFTESGLAVSGTVYVTGIQT